MVELYTMIKFSLSITVTNFRRKLSIKWIMRQFQNYPHILVGNPGDAVFEIHPPGTSDRLAALDQALGELCDAEAGSVFRLLEDGSIERPAQVDDDPNA